MTRSIIFGLLISVLGISCGYEGPFDSELLPLNDFVIASPGTAFITCPAPDGPAACLESITTPEGSQVADCDQGDVTLPFSFAAFHEDPDYGDVPLQGVIFKATSLWAGAGVTAAGSASGMTVADMTDSYEGRTATNGVGEFDAKVFALPLTDVGTCTGGIPDGASFSGFQVCVAVGPAQDCADISVQ